MEVFIKVTKVQDSVELEYFLKETRKLRNTIYSTPTPNFKMKVEATFEV